MVFNNMLKIDYIDELRFKHFEGCGFKPDVSLSISEEDSIELLTNIRDIVREGTTQSDVIVGNYEISVASYNSTAMSLTIMETRGQMSRPVGMFKYDKYMGGKSILQGLSEAIRDIESEM